MHDTAIYVPSRDDNCRLANRQLFVLMILFGLIRPGIIGQLIEKSDLRLFGIGEPNRSRSVMETELWFPLWRLPGREICPLIVERGTVSNHIVKLDAGMNASVMARCIYRGV